MPVLDAKDTARQKQSHTIQSPSAEKQLETETKVVAQPTEAAQLTEGDPAQPIPALEKQKSSWKNKPGPVPEKQIPYAILKRQRDSLLQEEGKLKRKIKLLEKESEDWAKGYEKLRKESKARAMRHSANHASLFDVVNDHGTDEHTGVLGQTNEENIIVDKTINQLERSYNPPPGIYDIDNDWDKALANARKLKEKESSIPTHGPFQADSNAKSVTIAETLLKQEYDEFDLQLDVIQSETQALLNKIKQLRREKEQIDYAKSMGNGPVIKNVTLLRAINEKLNIDLNKFSIRLEKLKIKYNAISSYREHMKHMPHSTRRIRVKQISPARSYKTRSSTKYTVESEYPNNQEQQSEKLEKTISNVVDSNTNEFNVTETVMNKDSQSNKTPRYSTTNYVYKTRITNKSPSGVPQRSDGDMKSSVSTANTGHNDHLQNNISTSDKHRAKHPESRFTDTRSGVNNGKIKSRVDSKRHENISHRYSRQIQDDVPDDTKHHHEARYLDNKVGKASKHGTLLSKTNSKLTLSVDNTTIHVHSRTPRGAAEGNVFNRVGKSHVNTSKYTDMATKQKTLIHGSDTPARNARVKVRTRNSGAIDNWNVPGASPRTNKGTDTGAVRGQEKPSEDAMRTYLINRPKPGDDTIRTYLMHRPKVDGTTRLSPISIRFKENAQSIGAGELKLVMNSSGMRQN